MFSKFVDFIWFVFTSIVEIRLLLKLFYRNEEKKYKCLSFVYSINSKWTKGIINRENKHKSWLLSYVITFKYNLYLFLVFTYIDDILQSNNNSEII